MKKYNLIFSLFVLLLAVNVISCQDDAESFDSKVITGDVSKKVATHLLKPGVDEMLQTFQATIPQPVESDIHIVYKAEPSLVTTYNEIYYDAAVALPEDYYEVKESNVIINKGSVVSTDVVLHFKDLTALNSNLVYVLPVTVAESDWELLESARTVYYVFKGAALINTVANIKERRLKQNFLHAGVLIGLKTITVEALVRADELNNKISTLMGVEGGFLLRFSDQGLPGNQLQLATGAGNATNSNWTIETGKWVHIAFTYNGNTGRSEMFVDGVSRGYGNKTLRTTVNWGYSYPVEDETELKRGFWIGYSYEAARYLDGDICECRIWNRVLTAEEIQAKNHFYYVDPKSEGLVAYWKFDEGQGVSITDYANENNLTANKDLIWKPLELPEKNQ